MLVTAETWERLLLTRISTFRGLLFSLCFSQISHVLLSTLPFCSPPLTQRGGSASSRCRHGLLRRSHNREWVDCSDRPYNLIEPGLLFLIPGPNCPLGSLFWSSAFHCTFPFPWVMLVPPQLSLGTRNRLFSRKFNENRYSNELWSSYPSPRMNIQFSFVL